MSDLVSLALVIHNHQPVGNFGWVIEDVYDHAYSPMLFALERHPGIRLGLHYTGPLLQWLAANKPEAVAQIRGLVGRGQVELVGGGFYEPILITLPDRDRHGQLVRMADELEARFGVRPAGAWLAERVWEPSLAYDLADAGYGWTVLDDSHLRAASIREDAMWTAFTTDDRGKRLTVFGTEQGLRYRIPFKPVEDVIAYLHERRTEDGRFVGMMGDDGEKFGAWPGTFEYCWSHEHWVDRLFEAIERNSDWLATVTPSEWLERRPPTTRVYFPTASYAEMTEWVLPPDETPVFSSLLAAARERGDPAARYLRGGFWRNYAARYREINDLHKQMLRASDKVDAMAPGEARSRALDHLYQGQSNDCYWHGLFGGIYIVHMRMATLSHLIAAEDLADAAAATGAAAGVAGAAAATGADAAAAATGADVAGATSGAAGRWPYGARLIDTDLDAIDEVLVTSPGQTVVIDTAEGAGITSWDLRASRVAVGSVLRRRPEAYHARLVAHDEVAAEQAVGDAAAPDGGASARDDAPKTIHDVFASKEPGLARFIHYDRHERRSGLVYLLPTDGSTGVRALVDATYEEFGDFVEGPFEVVTLTDQAVLARRLGIVKSGGAARPLVVEKSFRFGGDRLTPTLELAVTAENPGDVTVAFELALQWNVNLLGGGHNPAAWYELPDGSRTPHDSPGEVAEASAIAFGNDFEGVRIEASLEPAARLTWYPVETVSNSESGFERVYQGSCLMFRWSVSLAPGDRQTRTVRLTATQSIDHSAIERG